MAGPKQYLLVNEIGNLQSGKMAYREFLIYWLYDKGGKDRQFPRHPLTRDAKMSHSVLWFQYGFDGECNVKMSTWVIDRLDKHRKNSVFIDSIDITPKYHKQE